VLASALVLAAIARRLYGEKVALLVAPLYALTVSVGLPMDVHAANPETLFLLPLLAGTYLSLQGKERAVAAGVCVGLAALVKQQAGYATAILIAASWLERGSTPAVRAPRGRVYRVLGRGLDTGLERWRDRSALRSRFQPRRKRSGSAVAYPPAA